MTYDPHGPSPCVGRMPSIGIITPTNQSPWWGDWSEGGDLTRQQRYQLAIRGIDPAKIETMIVRRLAEHAEFYWGLTPRPHFAFPCPVLSRRADGKIYILAPIGDRKLIHASGWVNRVPPRRFEGQEDLAA